jgi:hypothetical protein
MYWDRVDSFDERFRWNGRKCCTGQLEQKKWLVHGAV